MSAEVDQIRLAAALSHAAPDADLELFGPGHKWLVSYRRPEATFDPCGFRQLVLAVLRGCRVGILPIDRIAFVGGLREIGGGVFERQGQFGMERRVATLLPPARVEALLTADHPGADSGVAAHVRGDVELGVTVVTIAAPPAVPGHCLDVVAHWLSAACLVDEVIEASAHGASR